MEYIIHSVHTPLFTEGVVRPHTKFSKKGGGGGLTRPQLLEGVAGGKEEGFSGGGVAIFR